MKILVTGEFNADSAFAHAINTIRMASGFAAAGHEVIMMCLAPADGPKTPQQLSTLYRTDADVRWIQLPSGVKVGGGFARHALRIARRERVDMVFARSYAFPIFSGLAGIPTVMESHAHVGRKSLWFQLAGRLAWRRAPFRLVTISDVLAEDYARYGFPPRMISVLPTGVDGAAFRRPEHMPPRPYPAGRKVAAYVGHLYDYKGVPQILQAASLLPSVDFHLIGGTAEDLARQQQRAQGLANVTFHGLVDPAQVPPYLWHADVLLLPPIADHPSAAWTSPVKLGEYMFAGTPVVATNIPALTHWLTDAEVTFVTDTGPALAEGIRHVLEGPELAAAKVASALRKAAEWTYVKRAEKLIAAVLPQAGTAK